MISLYESILNSTNSGKTYLVKKWCEENLSNVIGGEEQGYAIDETTNEILPCKGKHGSYFAMHLKNIKEKAPDYIKFGKIDASVFFDKAFLYLTQEQLPKECHYAYFSGKIRDLKDITLHTSHGLVLSEEHTYLNRIKNVKLYCNGEKPTIDLENSCIDIDSLKEITVFGHINRLNISNTPAAKEIQKMCKKYIKNSINKHHLEYIKSCKEMDDYCNAVFSNFPGLRFVVLSNRTMIEHTDPKYGGNWQLC